MKLDLKRNNLGVNKKDNLGCLGEILGQVNNLQCLELDLRENGLKELQVQEFREGRIEGNKNLEKLEIIF